LPQKSFRLGADTLDIVDARIGLFATVNAESQFISEREPTSWSWLDKHGA
jgi:hypothetical protein